MTYCYTSKKTKETVDRWFPCGKAKKFIVFRGVRYDRDRESELRTQAGPRPGAWPMTSITAGTHPKNVPKVREHLKKSGVTGVTVYPNGDVEWNDRPSRTKYLNAMGKVDRNGGYGDG